AFRRRRPQRVDRSKGGVVIDHEPHVSDLRWDLLLAGDLPDELRTAAYDHSAGCNTCATRMRELTAERDAFQTSDFAERIAQPVGLAPAYRDDLDAARARCASLEAELQIVVRKLGRLDELTRKLGKTNRGGDVQAAESGEQDRRVFELRSELRD